MYPRKGRISNGKNLKNSRCLNTPLFGISWRDKNGENTRKMGAAGAAVEKMVTPQAPKSLHWRGSADNSATQPPFFSCKGHYPLPCVPESSADLGSSFLFLCVFFLSFFHFFLFSFPFFYFNVFFFTFFLFVSFSFSFLFCLFSQPMPKKGVFKQRCISNGKKGFVPHFWPKQGV